MSISASRTVVLIVHTSGSGARSQLWRAGIVEHDQDRHTSLGGNSYNTTTRGFAPGRTSDVTLTSNDMAPPTWEPALDPFTYLRRCRHHQSERRYAIWPSPSRMSRSRRHGRDSIARFQTIENDVLGQPCGRHSVVDDVSRTRLMSASGENHHAPAGSILRSTGISFSPSERAAVSTSS